MLGEGRSEEHEALSRTARTLHDEPLDWGPEG